MKKYFLLQLLLLFTLTGCVVNETLNQVNKTLNDTTSVLSSGALDTAQEQDISHLMPNVNDAIQKEQIMVPAGSLILLLNTCIAFVWLNRAFLIYSKILQFVGLP